MEDKILSHKEMIRMWSNLASPSLFSLQALQPPLLWSPTEQWTQKMYLPFHHIYSICC